MYLVRFTCEGFRALHAVAFDPAPGINLIVGDNAQGKTSLLEAILFAATARSHRALSESELVRAGADFFQIRVEARRDPHPIAIDARWYQGVKRFRVNGVLQARISDILGKLCVVLFSPEDISLIKGTAAHRRKFLDMELSQISPRYLAALQFYRQSLRQRNEVLRAAVPDAAQLDAWDAQLVQHGAVLMQEREAFIARLSQYAAESYRRVAGGETMAIAYEPDASSPGDFAKILGKGRAGDIRRRATMRGPHRDDLDFRVEGQSARAFASQGQQKTAALAVRMAELELVRERIGEYPVFMLDEVFSELDEHRSRQLIDSLDPGVQCLLTATAVHRRHSLLSREHATFRIVQGNLEKE
ncbi:MAG TPA: DNA replication/repair protein RecF [Candidatus Hydrogenedentes bacterium]|nr:DNA replication/repair protein RecF [Candidatus Hydrogenedentota bacterium]HOV73664.1 DNA replication/repair protein RecF [Candidatus Hydrogenedentota bacterium]